MLDQCKYCHASEVVPVLETVKRDRSVSGNKYRRFCLSCDRWLPMCSKQYFESHTHPHVLPPDSELTDRTVVPIQEYDTDFVTPDDDQRSDRATNQRRGESAELDNHAGPTISDFRNPILETEDLYSQLRILQSSIKKLVDNNVVTEAEAYNILTPILSQVLSDESGQQAD